MIGAAAAASEAHVPKSPVKDWIRKEHALPPAGGGAPHHSANQALSDAQEQQLMHWVQTRPEHGTSIPRLCAEAKRVFGSIVGCAFSHGWAVRFCARHRFTLHHATHHDAPNPARIESSVRAFLADIRLVCDTSHPPLRNVINIDETNVRLNTRMRRCSQLWATER